MKKVEVGICYVNLLHDVLNILKDSKYQVLQDNGFKTEVEEGYMEMWFNDLLDNFCKPLMEYDKDTEIILKE